MIKHTTQEARTPRQAFAPLYEHMKGCETLMWIVILLVIIGIASAVYNGVIALSTVLIALGVLVALFVLLLIWANKQQADEQQEKRKNAANAAKQWTNADRQHLDILKRKAESGGDTERLALAEWLYEHKQFEESIQWYEQVAKPWYNMRKDRYPMDNPETKETALANYKLGMIYSQGMGVVMDTKKGFQYFVHSHMQGSREGTRAVADAHRYGVGVSKSVKTANLIERQYLN